MTQAAILSGEIIGVSMAKKSRLFLAICKGISLNLAGILTNNMARLHIDLQL